MAELIHLCTTKDPDPNKLRQLIENGQNVNYHSVHMGITALRAASCHGHFHLVRELLAYGADVNARNDLGETALMGACGNYHEEFVSLLLQFGANVNLKTGGGNTALLICMNSPMQLFNEKIVAMLIDAGADIDHHDNCGNTALTSAIRHENLDRVVQLLDAGASVDKKASGFFCFTALEMACDCDAEKVVSVLLRECPNLDYGPWIKPVRMYTECMNLVEKARDAKPMPIVALHKKFRLY